MRTTLTLAALLSARRQERHAGDAARAAQECPFAIGCLRDSSFHDLILSAFPHLITTYRVRASHVRGKWRGAPHSGVDRPSERCRVNQGTYLAPT